MTTEITLNNKDFEKISMLLDNADADKFEALQNELERATVIDQKDTPKDLVTMNTSFEYKSLDDQKLHKAMLVYPGEEDMDEGKISILAPIGQALIGLRVGQTIDWTLPNGKTRPLKIEKIHYQPEASGDWHL